MLETLDYTIRIGSTPTFLYFDLYLYSAYAAHYVYVNYRPPAGNSTNVGLEIQGRRFNSQSEALELHFS